MFHADLLAWSNRPWAAWNEDIANKLLGRKLGFGFQLPDTTLRWFHGLIQKITGDYQDFRVTVRPMLSTLDSQSNCRVFADKNIQEIITEVLKNSGFDEGGDFEWRLTQKKYPKYELCVQYRETTLNFITRLLEQEGVFYIFESTHNSHKLIFADCLEKWPGASKPTPVPFRRNGHADKCHLGSAVFELTNHSAAVAASYTLNAYNWRKLTEDLVATEKNSNTNDTSAHRKLYDLGEHQDRAYGERYARLRMEEVKVKERVITGSGSIPSFCSGMAFQLVDPLNLKEPFPSQALILTSVEHYAVAPVLVQSPEYHNSFSVLPQGVAFRPARETPKPILVGITYGVVAGPPRADGCVQVRFWWDRRGTQQPPVWLRLVQPWAGKSFGTWFPPRENQEVVIAFEDGDPDRPIIVGSVYEAEDHPFTIRPTVSGIFTQSSPGALNVGNKLTFEDAADKEEVFIHAQRDLKRIVEHDEKSTIKGKRAEEIGINYQLDVRHDMVVTADGTFSIKCGDCHMRMSSNGFIVEIKGSKIAIGPNGVQINGQVVSLNQPG